MANAVQGAEPLNILIVDDVSSNLIILSEMVKAMGCAPRPVVSVKQALTAIERKIPHLILLDVTMPDMNGFEFCAMLKADVRTRDIPIIFISALDSVEDKIKGFKLGAVDYIAKPFEREEVTMRLNTHLNIYKMKQEMETYNKKLHQMITNQISKVSQEQKNILSAMINLVSIQDDETPAHIKNIGANSRTLAISLQFSPKFDKDISSAFVDEIELASQLHDIGMIGVKDDIISKHGVLNEDEWESVKRHTSIGGEHLDEIYQKDTQNEYVKMAAQIARYHHENWNGTGYPEGLSGEEIPLAARIMAVVDTFEALGRDRSYRDSYTLDEALEIMHDETGKRFDPNIMEIFFKVQKQLKFG